VPSLADVVAHLDRWYPPSAAAEWDAVGPVCGDPDADVSRVLLAVDPVEEVVDEALAVGADLLLVHHPLYLRGTSTVYAGTTKGRLVQRLVTHGCALVVAHTNADDADHGVSHALAEAVGLTGPLAPLVPSEASPATGTGRYGVLAEPTTLGAFAQQVADALPGTPVGVRVGGAPDREVRTVAVCGGAGDAFLDVAAAVGADVYVTADLRHHLAGEHLACGGPALVDPGHWASEWPWLPVAARLLEGALGPGTVDVRVSTTVTDPWTALRRRELR
jgi:dinuclear metal center YbgI/SA1388 family protein